MLDHRLVELIERIGYVNEHGERIHGTAALLHFVHRPVSSISQEVIRIGEAFVQKYLNS